MACIDWNTRKANWLQREGEQKRVCVSLESGNGGQCINFSAAAEVEVEVERQTDGERQWHKQSRRRAKGRFSFSDSAVAPSQLRLDRGTSMIGPDSGIRRANLHNLRARGATTEEANGETILLR